MGEDVKFTEKMILIELYINWKQMFEIVCMKKKEKLVL